jgi:hypothetical protein
MLVATLANAEGQICEASGRLRLHSNIGYRANQSPLEHASPTPKLG